jgi:small-conductance mechanosensitive channel
MRVQISEILTIVANWVTAPETLRQLYWLGAILVTSWTLGWLLKRALRRWAGPQQRTGWKEKLLDIVEATNWPLITLFLLAAAIQIWTSIPDGAVGLLEAAQQVTVVWLIYKVLVVLLRRNLPADKARLWRQKVLLPAGIVLAGLAVTGLLEVILNWGFTLESVSWQITIGSILLAGLIVGGFILLGRWVRHIMVGPFLREAGLDAGLVQTVSAVASYTIIGIGIFIALGSIGLNLTTLTVIAGGASVGLAFGLQEIFNNFISGFILIFERSLEPGQVVEVDDNTGSVTKVGIRSTTIRTLDNVELIVPNSRFLTETVTNLTKTEDLVRARIDVGVSYNSDPHQVREVLLEAAQKHPKILADPAPTVQFSDFGASSLDFSLLVWTNDALQLAPLKSDLRYDIWDALATHNIEIPFPQRDIHIRSSFMQQPPA